MKSSTLSTDPKASMMPPTMVPTETAAPTPVYGGSLLTYTVSDEDRVSLIARTALGETITLVSGMDDVMVLDHTPADGGKLAVKVVEDGAEMLWIISADGTPIRAAIFQGWLRINHALWSPNGSWLVVEADIPGLTTYYIYDGLDGALLSQPPLFPRSPTPTLTHTPASTQTGTSPSSVTQIVTGIVPSISMRSEISKP